MGKKSEKFSYWRSYPTLRNNCELKEPNYKKDNSAIIDGLNTRNGINFVKNKKFGGTKFALEPGHAGRWEFQKTEWQQALHGHLSLSGQ